MRDDLHAQVEVGDHCAHHGELLEILLTEYSEMGSGGVEELGDHGRHAVEVPRSRHAFHRFGQSGDVHGRGEPGRVHHVG